MPRPQTGLATLQSSFAVPTNNLLQFRSPKSGTIVKFAVYAATAPSGGAATFDLKKNGVSALGAALSLSDGSNSANVNPSASVNEGDLLRVDLLTTPSSIGNDLTVYVDIEETGASASDASLLARTNHTGTQTASTISDFSEAVDDRIDALIVAGAAIKKTYDDGANTYTLDLDITELTEDTTPDAAADFIVAYDASASAHKKVKIANLPFGGGGFNNAALGARVTKSGTQSINSGSNTTLTFDQEVADDGGFHDNVTNNSRLTVPAGKGGWYVISACIRFVTNATGARFGRIILNGGTTSIPCFSGAPAVSDASTASLINICCILKLAAGDYVEVQAYQASGGALNVDNSGDQTWFAISSLGSGGDIAPDNLYVNASTGNDTTGDGSSGTPYATVTKALSVLPYRLEKDHTINVADGTYAEAIVIKRFTSAANCRLKIVGNVTTPANVNFTGTQSETVRGSAVTAAVVVAGDVQVEFEGIQAGATATHGFFFHSGANVIFDRCTAAGTTTTGVAVWNYAQINIQGNCTLSGWSTRGLQLLAHALGIMTSAGTLTCTGPGSAGIGIHVLNNSQFANYSSEPSGCNITITGVQYGFQLAFASSFTWQSSGATLTVDNSSTPGSSAGVFCTDHSSWSTNQTVTLDNLSFGYQGNSISYIEAVGTRNHTNLGGTSDATQNTVIYLP